MKPIEIVFYLLLSMFIIGCSGQRLPTQEPIPPTITSLPSTVTPKPTITAIPPTITIAPKIDFILPVTVEANGEKVNFNEWGLSIELPSNVWGFNPSIYSKTTDREAFVFSRIDSYEDETGEKYSPTIFIMFYSVPENTQLINFSSILRSQQGKKFPSIDSIFGYEGSEPRLKIPALGYYGHLGADDVYSVYIVHTVNGTVGVQVSLEIADSVLDQARDEFFQIISSMEFIDRNTLTSGSSQVNPLAEETYQSKMSAVFISEALMAGGLNLKEGSDGKGKGTDSKGRINTCADLALNLTKFQQYKEIVINDTNKIDTTVIHPGDVVIFSDAIMPRVTDHAALITKIENGMIYIISIYGPMADGSYLISNYSNSPVTELLLKVFREMHIYSYQE